MMINIIFNKFKNPFLSLALLGVFDSRKSLLDKGIDQWLGVDFKACIKAT